MCKGYIEKQRVLWEGNIISLWRFKLGGYVFELTQRVRQTLAVFRILICTNLCVFFLP